MIDNSRTLEELDGLVEELHKEFLLRAEHHSYSSADPAACTASQSAHWPREIVLRQARAVTQASG